MTGQVHALSISPSELRRLRMRAQCLEPRLSRATLVHAVKAAVGINAQFAPAMALSLRARVEGLAAQHLEASRVDDRALVRTWCMRGTMHLLAADDLDWLLSAIPPSLIAGSWRWLEQRGGLERERAERVVMDAYRAVKARGPMTRPELISVLAKKHGPEIKTAAAGIVRHNALLGRMCFGPDHGAQPTYVALDQWLGRKVELSSHPDHVELARRYLRGYGPARPQDMAAWFGLTLTEVKAAWAALGKELREIEAEGESLWMLAAETAPAAGGHPGHVVRLLPAFDTLLLGYHGRDLVVPDKYRGRIFHGGEIVPTVLVDGCAAGTWRYDKRGDRLRITVSPFASFTRPIRERIAEEANDVGRFWGLAVELSPSAYLRK